MEFWREIKRNYLSQYIEPRIDELTPEVLNAFVDKIVVHEREKKDGRRTQQIDIYYSYVGIVDIPTDEEMREMEQEYMHRTKRQTA